MQQSFAVVRAEQRVCRNSRLPVEYPLRRDDAEAVILTANAILASTGGSLKC